MSSIIAKLQSTIVLILLAGCAGSKSLQTTDTGDIPDWYGNPPSDQSYYYGVNTQVSQDLQLAFDKASQGARADIARQVEARMQGFQDRFTRETGIGTGAQLLDDFRQATKTVVSNSLSGSKVIKQEQLKDGNNWRAYVLVQYPQGAANEALIQQMKSNQQLYSKFEASQAFKDLNEEVQKYEEWKKSREQKK